jgi:predicted nucleotide-binding protein
MDLYKDLLELLENLKTYRSLLESKEAKSNDLFVGLPIIQDVFQSRSKGEITEELREKLVRSVGRVRQRITEITGKEKLEKWGRVYDIWSTGLTANPSAPVNFDALNACIDVTNEAIGKLEAEGNSWQALPNKIENKNKLTDANVKAFISHGKDSLALSKIEKFLRDLGVEPLIVKDRPSLGKTVSEKVDYYLNQADCAIILATADDNIDGKLCPRQNITHEIGLAQKTLEGKIIYLLEQGTEFPSNISPRVWESFTQDNLENVFSRIIKELKAFGLM